MLRRFRPWMALCLAGALSTTSAYARANLTNVTAVPSRATAGSPTIYTISFNATSGLPATGRIAFTFPAGFNVSEVEIASNVTGLNGGYSAITVAGQTVTITRDGTGTALAPGAAASLKLATIYNTTVSGNYTVSITTQTSTGAIVDGPTASAPFAVTAAALDRFTFAAITQKTAGRPFVVTVTAKDRYNNNVLHSGTVTLSDNTGSLTASPLNFTDQTSQSIVDAIIRIARPDAILTATGSGVSGTSAPFAVVADTLHSIRIAQGTTGGGMAVPDTALTADQSLALHVAAYDSFGNYIGDVPSDWQMLGGIGTLSASSNATAATFAATTVGSGRIAISDTAGRVDTTGTITVAPGLAYQVKILTGASGDTPEYLDTNLATGATDTLHAASFDADGNYIEDVSVTWAVVGGIGTVNPASGIFTVFSATTPGSGQIRATHPVLIADFTGTITVGAGALAYVKIVEGPFGDGPELGARSLSADQTLTLHAAGYDANNNYLGDQVVTWSSSGGLRPIINATAASITFSPTTAPVTGSIMASHPTAQGDATGTISVTVGAPHHVKVLSGAAGNTNEVTTAGLTAGSNLTVHAGAFDADDNYIDDIDVNWSVSGGIGTLFPTSGISTILTATTAGTGQITASHPTLLDDATGTITVTRGTLAFVKIVEGPSGDGPELGTKSITADQTLTVHAAGYDAQGNYIGDQTVTWTNTGDLEPPINRSGTSLTFSPTLAPASGTIVATHPTATDDATGEISVTPGAPHHVKVMTGSSGNTSELGNAGLTTGQKLIVHASAFDADENYTGDVTVNWSVSGGIGTLSATLSNATEFTATTPGSGQIIATSSSLLDDASGIITVTSGTVAQIRIVEGISGPGPRLTTKSLTADDILFIHAAGYDAQGNYVGDQSVTWSNTGTLAPAISGTGTSIAFNPRTAPASGTIRASHPTANDDETGLISVSVGAEHRVKVLAGASGNTSEVGSVGLTTGNTLNVHAASFDADDNYIRDIAVDWSLSGGIGTLFPASGVSTTLTATRAGTGQITANHATLFDDATGIISVNAGTLAFVRIVEGTSGDGPELDSRELTADQTLTVHAAGYDASGNYIGDQTVTWGSTGTLAPAISGSGPSITFSPTTAPATGTITAQHNTAQGDETGTISVRVGQPHHVKVLSDPGGNTPEVGNVGLTTGGTLAVHAASFDADNNYITDVSVTWQITGGIGTLSPGSGVTTTFTATTPGTGQITAVHPTLLDDATGVITVNSGTLAYVKIVEGPSGNGPELTTRSMTADEVLTVHAAGYDAQGNYLGDQSVSWGTTGTLAPVLSGSSPSITFSPTRAPASGTITATHPTAQDDQTGTISVGVGAPFRVKILDGPSGNTAEVNTAGLTTGQTITVHAASFDADNNYIADVSVGWSVTGGIGSVSPANGVTTTFTATTPGTGVITATHPTLINDVTGTITVNSGSLAFVKIVQGPSGDGPELDTRAITADQTLTVHAAGYDAQGNYIGDQTVTWSSTGTLEPALSGSGPSITFSPTRAPASGTIVATHATATGDATGTISVSVGRESRVKVLSGASGNTSEVATAGLTTGGTLVVHAASFDADDNYVQDVSVSWSLSGGIGTLSPATGISTTFTATTPGTGQITASHPTLIDDATGTITVNAGSLAYVKIVEGPSGNGPELGTKSLTADEILTIHAAGYDAQGNYLGDQTVTWSSTGTLTPALSGSGPSITFRPTRAPASGTIVASHPTATGDATGPITVSVGTPFRVKILTGTSGNTPEFTTASLSAGQTIAMHAARFDADDNYIDDVSVTYTVSGGIGNVSPPQGISTVLTATRPGTGQVTASHPTLLGDVTGIITVTASGLAYIKIVEGPAGAGPELTTKSLTSDDVLTVHAAGYDANDNYLGDQVVTWGSTGSLAPALSGSGTSITFSPTRAPATGTITADHPTAADDETGTISVSVGQPRRIKVMSGASGNTSEVMASGLTTGGTLVVHASSFDADDNYVADVSVTWSVTGGIGTLSDASGVSTTLTATTPGSGVISASHPTLIDDATGTITVNAGSLAYVKIVEGPSGPGPELTTKSLTADQSLTIHAAGYDANNNYLGDQTVTWRSTGTLAPAISGSGPAFTFNPARAPASGTIIAEHATARDDTSGTITITTGAPQRVKVMSGASGNTSEVMTAGLTTGGTLVVHASSFDADDNYITDVAVNWSVSGGIGVVNPSTNSSTTTFTATTPGTGVISASHPTLIDDATGTITVNAGNLAYIKIVEGPGGHGPELGAKSLTADDILTVHAAGYDASNNYIGDQTVTWSSTGTLTPALNATASSISFNPTRAPASGTIRATHPTATGDETGTISVSVGAERYIAVLEGASGNTPEVRNVTLTTSDLLTVHASSFDADNNYVRDVSVAWSVSGGIGTLNPLSGTATTLTATTAGSGVISADHATLVDDATGTITVQAGQLSYVRIVEGPTGAGPPIGNRNLTTDDVLRVHAAGYDASNNYIGDQAVNWSISGGIGNVNPAFGTTTTLSLTRPGTGRLFADHPTARDDSTGVLNVTGGSLYRVKVLIGASGNTPVVGSTSLTTDETLVVHAGGFDINDNYLGDYSVTWTVSGNIGTLSSSSGISTTLNPRRIGNGQLIADHPTAIDGQSGIITVTGGALSFIKVVEGPSGNGPELGNRSLTADQTLTVHAAGFDADSNYVGDQSVEWSSTGTLAPAVSGSGTNFTFSPTTAPASGTIRATHATAGSDETGTISVAVGRLFRVAVLSGGAGATSPVGDTFLNPGQQLVVHAGGFDADNNYIADQSVSWSVAGPIGTIAPPSGTSATFSAQTVGTGTIRALPSGNVLSGTSGTITVQTGNVARVIIRTAPNNGGVEFGNFSMTTDQEVRLYAAGYDAGNNYFGDVNVNWSSTGNLAPAVSATGSSFNFVPAVGAPGGGVSGTIVATFAPSISDATGTITVLPGAPVGDIALTATPPGLPADGTSTSTISSDQIRDAKNNLVGAGRLFTVSATPASLGTFVTPDADAVTPGHQIATNSDSRLSFVYRAGNTGGVAAINASSGLAASGNTQVTLGSLSIVSIATAPDFVSRGQRDITVNMTVKNLGSSTISNLEARLSFTGTADRTSEYTIVASGDNPTSLVGNATVSLSFLVTVSTVATLEEVTIDGVVSGVVNGTQVSSSGAEATDRWRVQRPAAVQLASVTTAPDTVLQGQTDLVVTVRASNNLGQGNSADAVIDSVRLRFRQGPVDVSSQYVVAANPANATVIPGNGTVDLTFTVNVGSSASVGAVDLDAEIHVRDRNSNERSSVLNAVTRDRWVVVEGNAFRILSITTSQPAVTEGMLKEWLIRMRMQNSGSSGITLDFAPDKTFLRLVIGSLDVTSQYTFVQPTQFEEGGRNLGPGATATAVYRVTRTGTSTGIVTISGFAAGTDNATGLPISDNTNDTGTGEVRVQRRGNLSITAVTPSQTSVTAGRNFDWTVTATVTNTGESAVKLNANPSSITIGANTGYVYVQPQFFVDGDSILDASETKSFRITVDRTGTELGSLPIAVTLTGTELNSGRAVPSNSGGATILSQSPANLRVLSVRPSRQTVTSGQTNPWTITAVVENTGQSAVTLRTDTSTVVRFRLNGIFQNDYVSALQAPNWLGRASTNLPGNAVDSLRFVVSQTGINTGFPAIWVQASTRENNSQTPIAANDNGSTSFQVQSSAQVTYVANSMVPDIVNNNSFYAFRVKVNNGGQSTVTLQPALTTFEFSDGTNSFVAPLDANLQTTIPPGEIELTFRLTQVPAGMARQRYTPVIKLRGTQNATAFARDLAVTTNELEVAAPANVQILSVRPSQSLVTRQMEKDWFITMLVANNGGAAIALDSVEVVLFNGGDVTPEYTIAKPGRFLSAGTTLLAPGGVDSLRFEIQRTGIRTGPTTIQGRLWVIDQSNQQQIFIQTEGGGGAFEVQSPAVLQIAGITTSQPRVTVNQTVAWFIDVQLTNAGGSDLQLVFKPDSSNIALSLNTGNYQFSYPAALQNGTAILPGNSSSTLRFGVTRTGSQPGTSLITGYVHGIERNSGDLRVDSTRVNTRGTIIVENPARLRLRRVAMASAPNVPYVNTNQAFAVEVQVENFGQETADSVQVELRTAGTSAIAQPLQLVPASLAGGNSRTISFNVTAANTQNPAERFTARLVSAKARNTGLSATLEPALDDTTTAVVQAAADLDIFAVTPSVARVTAEQNVPWRVYVRVRNSGTAVLRLNEPQERDIRFLIEGAEQRDYTITAPAALANNGTLILRGGQSDTLIYVVENTGRLGGQANIVVSLTGTDRNTGQALAAQANGNIIVETTAAVRILRTDPVVFNVFGTTGVGIVNTGQAFGVRVTIESTGFEAVRNVQLQLATNGNSVIPETGKIIPLVPAGETREVVFAVNAAAAPTTGLTTESFTSTIISATAAESNEPATIFLPADNLAQVQIQRPADLALTLTTDDDDNVLSTNQLLVVTARVQNNGQADVDSSGRVTIELPADFVLLEPGANAFEQRFLAGQAVRWTVRAPSTSQTAALLRVRITRQPVELNSNTAATVSVDTREVSLSVVPFDLAITKTAIIEPAGAQDNVLSTGQAFRLEARVALSADLRDRPRTIVLQPPPGYTLDTPAQIDNFEEIETWELTAPLQPHGPRNFIVLAQATSGQGEILRSADTLRVTLVSAALLQLDAFISEPPGATDNVLSFGQAFTIRANLTNRGTAGVVDSGHVRLELGQTKITVTEPLEQKIAADNFVVWRARAPMTVEQGDITVRLLRRPLDENTGFDAAVVSEFDAFSVRTDSSGSIFASTPRIISPPGAGNHILSTSQEFTVSVDLLWNNVRNLSAKIELPVGFATEDVRRNFTAQSGPATATWNITAPPVRGAAQSIFVTVNGNDANNDTARVAYRSESIQVEVVDRATLRLRGFISAPQAAVQDGIVSLNQEFEITGVLENLGQAGVIGDDRIRLQLPEGYSTPEPLEKSSVAGTVRWVVKARSQPSRGIDNLKLLLTIRPLDENTNQPAQVENIETDVPVRTEPKRMRVTSLPVEQVGPTAASQQGVVMLRLRVLNEGNESSSKILFRGISIFVENRAGEAVAPAAALKRMRAQSVSTGRSFGEVSPSGSDNPLILNFATPDTLTGGIPDEINLIIDIADNPAVKDFQLALISSESFDAIDADSRQPVEIVDELGNTGADLLIVSQSSPLSSADYTDFYNYPNPFRPGNNFAAGEGTMFNYFLPQNSEVEFKILTLTGELVYEQTFAANSAQGQAGARSGNASRIFWDGFNGDGKKVLNGVYIAVIKTSAGVVTRKIAVAK